MDSVGDKKLTRFAAVMRRVDDFTSGLLTRALAAAAPPHFKRRNEMAVNKNTKHQTVASSSAGTLAAGRKHGPKSLGTRLGTIEDWREGSKKLGRVAAERGNALRDGR